MKYELWRLIRIWHFLNRFKYPRMKIDMIQTLMNRFNQSQKVLWYDSLKFESIQAGKKEKLMLLTFELIRRFSESIYMNRFKKTVNRFTVILLENCELIHCDTIQENFTRLKRNDKENEQKECLIWINESWIESSNSQKDFPMHDNTQDIKESHDTMRHGLLGVLTSF